MNVIIRLLISPKHDGLYPRLSALIKDHDAHELKMSTYLYSQLLRLHRNTAYFVYPAFSNTPRCSVILLAVNKFLCFLCKFPLHLQLLFQCCIYLLLLIQFHSSKGKTQDQGLGCQNVKQQGNIVQNLKQKSFYEKRRARNNKQDRALYLESRSRPRLTLSHKVETNCSTDTNCFILQPGSAAGGPGCTPRYC